MTQSGRLCQDASIAPTPLGCPQGRPQNFWRLARVFNLQCKSQTGCLYVQRATSSVSYAFYVLYCTVPRIRMVVRGLSTARNRIYHNKIFVVHTFLQRGLGSRRRGSNANTFNAGRNNFGSSLQPAYIKSLLICSRSHIKAQRQWEGHKNFNPDYTNNRRDI